MSAFRFVLNKQAADQLARSAGVEQFLHDVATDAAAEVDRRAPRIVKGAGMSIGADSERGEARVVVVSPFWHWPEYGTSKYPAKSYLRPGVQAIITRRGGRWKEDT